MPKILINEKDFTSPGTPGSYGNYAVLITGYAARTPVLTKDATESTPADKIQPDANGVYEFSSKQDFLDTIGTFTTSEDEICKKSGDEVTEYHYGYRMARELLGLGYQVIYKKINQVREMDNENFWAIFKDKASYDFRFISHGMLETCSDQAKHTGYYTRLKEIDDALNKLAELEKTVNAGETITWEDFSKLDPTEKAKYDTAYTTAEYAFKDNTGTLTDEGLTYSSYTTAKPGLTEDRTQIQNAIKTHNSAEFTVDIFNNINGHIANLASYRTDKANTTVLCGGRGDCTALIELDEDAYCEYDPSKRPEELIVLGINGMNNINANNGPYCALTVPSVYYIDGKNTMKMPGAFHYLACFMSSLGSGFAEWYAAAGYNRGVSSYVIDHTSVKLGEIAINTLEPRNLDDDPQTVQPKFACNVIANFRGSYYLWGNRTAAELKAAADGGDLTAEHFLNIRQLCSTIKKQLYVSCRRFTFDPNSDTLWINFVNSITPTLDAMKADQGIRDYKIVKEFTDKKATLKARIRIIPIEAVEDFDIMVTLEDSFGETTVTA